MPVITIDMLEGRSIEQKRKLVRTVTDAVCESIDAKPSKVLVKLNDISPENLASSGELMIDQED